MQANGDYYSTRSSRDPRYSYDGSDYGSTISMGRKSTGPWNGLNAGHDANSGQDQYDSRPNARASFEHGITNGAKTQAYDDVGLHLLYETALTDSRSFSILSMAEVDGLKKEHDRLTSRMEATNRKLALENKVKDAAQNLHRLYMVGNAKGRPDTPQSPSSDRRSRGSLLGNKPRESGASSVPHSQTLHQAEDELASSIKKVDELNESYKGYQERKADVERKLLSHTAAVLAEQAQRAKAPTLTLPEKHPDQDHNQRSPSIYSPDEFDSIRDILHSKPGRPSQKSVGPDQSAQFADIQIRLEQLNDQLREILGHVGQTGEEERKEGSDLEDSTEDITSRLNKRFMGLEQNIRFLQQHNENTSENMSKTQGELSKVQGEMFKAQEKVSRAQVEVDKIQRKFENDLASANSRLHNIFLSAPDAPNELKREPPEATGRGYQGQWEYLEHGLGAVDQLLLKNPKSTAQAQRISEYETTLSGLWDLINDGVSPVGDQAASPLKEDFSLPAFSSRVQNLHDRATAAAQQQDILRRQIQQQRETSGDVEAKDREIEDLRARHADLSQAHEEAQEQLAEVIAKHARAETEASRSRTELNNVAKEFDELQKAIDARKQERDEMSRQLDTHRVNAQAAKDLEAEVVRLTTELTMAKADLDAASGSRAERARAAQADTSRAAELESELEEMTIEFQELTRESVELEKEREQLDALVDQLRERCEGLEAQISDDKVRWMGAKSPNSPAAHEGPRESTSVSVLRQEFKKMVRETRAEGFRALKIEQEERRRLEAEVRRLRQSQGTNGRGARLNTHQDSNGHTGTATTPTTTTAPSLT